MGGLRKIFGKGGGKVIGIIVGTIIGTASGNPVLGAQIGAALGSGADTAAQNHQQRSNRRIRENALEEREKAEKAKLERIRNQVRQRVEAARSRLQNDSNALARFEQEENAHIAAQEEQTSQASTTIDPQIQLNEETLRAARTTWQQIIREEHNLLDKQIQHMLCLSECCKTRNFQQMIEHLLELDLQLLSLIEPELLQICLVDDVDTISWLISNRFKNQIRQKQSQILIRALRQGTDDEVIAALNEGADVNAVLTDEPMYAGYSTLHIAGHWGRLNAVKRLLQQGADIASTNSTKQNLLFLTVWNSQAPGCREVLEYLLNSYPDQMRKQLLAKMNDGITPLYATIMNAHQDLNACIATATKLIQFGADVNQRDVRGRTAEDLANEYRQPRLAEIIGMRGAQQAELDERLCDAAFSGDETALLAAIKAGANVNARGAKSRYSRFPVLLIAASWGQLNAVKILLQHGADLEAKTLTHHGVLYWTVWNFQIAGCREVLDYLLKTYPAQMRKQLVEKTDDGQTPLHAIIVNAHHDLNACIATAIKLIQFGTDVNQRDVQGRTAEDLASKYQQSRLAEIIRVHGARQAELDERLCDAAFSGDETALLVAIEEGANVNARGAKSRYSRFPALLIAACWGQLNPVKVLLQHGADIEAKTLTNHGVLYWTVWNSQTAGCREVLDYLLKAYPAQMRRQLIEKTDDGQTPLHALRVNAHIDLRACQRVARKLIYFGADAEQRDKQGQTAAQLAAQEKQYELAIFIDKMGLRKKSDQGASFKRTPDSLVKLCLTFLNSNPKGELVRKNILQRKVMFPNNLYPFLQPVKEVEMKQEGPAHKIL